MQVYADLVMLLNFLVDFLLLLGTNRLTGHPARAGRAALSAALGGVYSGCCLIPGFRFLSGLLWRLVSLGAMAGIAFGWNRSVLRRGALFVVLSMALGGLALGIGSGSFWTLIAAAAGLFALCAIGQRQIGSRTYALVELRLGDRRRKLTALRDTGNMLSDPITGQPVLVVSGNIAREMLGLTREQLLDPIGTLAKGSLPGLRLIPYRAVGQPGGMLLAIKMDEIRIDGAAAGKLVAFAPEKLGSDGYEALTGGVL